MPSKQIRLKSVNTFSEWMSFWQLHLLLKVFCFYQISCFISCRLGDDMAPLQIYSNQTMSQLQELARSQNLSTLKPLFDLLPLTVVLTNPENQIVFVNKKFESLTGYTFSEVQYKNPRILKAPQKEKVNYRELWATITSGKTWHGVFKNRSKSGEFFWEKAHIAPLLDEHGKVQFFLALKEDISEQKNLESALKESESRYRNLFDKMSNGYASFRFIRDEQGKIKHTIIEDMNLAFESIMELGNSKYIDLDVENFLPKILDNWTDLFIKALHKSIKKYPDSSFEVYSETEHKWLEVQVNLMGEDYFGALFIDNTRHKLAEQTNRDLVVQLKSKIKQLNLLYELSNLVGTHLNNVENFIQQGYELIQKRYQNTGLNFYLSWGEVELGHLESNKNTIVFVHKNPLGNDLFTFEAYCIDESQAKSFNHEIFVFEIFTKEFVYYCDVLIHEESLKKQQEQIFQSSKLMSLGELTSGVAHEINNPINYILLNTSILQDLMGDMKSQIALIEKGKYEPQKVEEISQNFDEFLETIIDGSNRIKKIVQSLKEYSAHDDSHQYVQVDVHKIIKNSLVIINNPIVKNVRTFIYDTAEPVYIKGIEHQLEQVIINVVNNAIRAIPKNSGVIEIKVNSLVNVVEIAVIDNGLGIPQEHLTKLTDPFFTTYRSKGGTGLGLSISSQIMSNHRGEIGFESQEGEGTQVTLTLPLMEGV